jgi:hypothetical protein
LPRSQPRVVGQRRLHLQSNRSSRIL